MISFRETTGTGGAELLFIGLAQGEKELAIQDLFRALCGLLKEREVKLCAIPVRAMMRSA